MAKVKTNTIVMILLVQINSSGILLCNCTNIEGWDYIQYVKQTKPQLQVINTIVQNKQTVGYSKYQDERVQHEQFTKDCVSIFLPLISFPIFFPYFQEKLP